MELSGFITIESPLELWSCDLPSKYTHFTHWHKLSFSLQIWGSGRGHSKPATQGTYVLIPCLFHFLFIGSLAPSKFEALEGPWDRSNVSELNNSICLAAFCCKSAICVLLKALPACVRLQSDAEFPPGTRKLAKDLFPFSMNEKYTSSWRALPSQ